MSIKSIFIIGRIIYFFIFLWEKFVDFIRISTNRLKWLWIYYIKEEKDKNFAIDRRKSKNIIYCDGHMIVVNEYSIFMLDNGEFEIEKGFQTSNNQYTDLSIASTACKGHLDRFKDCIVRVEPINKKPTGTLQITNFKACKETISFKVSLDSRERFETFDFGLYISIPKEFENRIDLDDKILLKKKIYGQVEFELKIDKDAPQINKFAPKIIMNGKYIKPEITEDLFYIGRKWKFLGLLNSINDITITHKEE